MLDSQLVANVYQPLLAGATLAGGIALAHGIFVPQSRLLGTVVSHGSKSHGLRIALTFDDGPWPGSTDAILDVLRVHGVPAAFFVIGRYARQWPDLIRRAHDEGHLIANHTFDHHRLGLFRGFGYWRRQIARTDDVINATTGVRPTFFRPPMGFKSPPVMLAARRLNHRIVAWSRRSGDGVKTTPQRIISALSGEMEPGAIVLLHDGRDPASRREMSATPQALPILIESFRARGITMVRLDDLIRV